MEGNRNNEGDEDVLLELYKISDENHRFYVNKRFTIITFYFPLMTLVLSGIYVLASQNYRVFISIFGIVLVLLLYSLENRNWILNNICLNNCIKIASKLMVMKKINGNDNLHLKLSQSYKENLPEGSTFLDRFVIKIANTQHRMVSWMTFFLLLYWTGLALVPLFGSRSLFLGKDRNKWL